MDVSVDTSHLRKRMKEINDKRPIVMQWIMNDWLIASAEEIKHKSMTMATQKGIRGVTGNYQGGFRRSEVLGTPKDKKIAIFNIANYSLVIEYGGKWTNKMPPPGALDKWVERKIHPENPDDVKRIAYAIGRSYVKRGRAGQKARAGYYLMINAFKQSYGKIQRWLGQLVKQGLSKL